MPELRIVGIQGIPEVKAGDDLARLILAAAADTGVDVESGDVVVIAQKIVSKAEGRIVSLESIEASALAIEWAGQWGKEAAVVEIVLRESKRIVRMDRGILIAETHQGFICANAGVDFSNAPAGAAMLLPVDPDSSAREIREGIRKIAGVDVGIIVSDTFGRPWREGQVNVALGVAGLQSLQDYRGEVDRSGRRLSATVIATADELASAAEIVMSKSRGVPAALIRGLERTSLEGTGRSLLRRAEEDMFR